MPCGAKWQLGGLAEPASGLAPVGHRPGLGYFSRRLGVLSIRIYRHFLYTEAGGEEMQVEIHGWISSSVGGGRWVGFLCLAISTHLPVFGFSEPTSPDLHPQALQEVQKHPPVQAGIIHARAVPSPGITFLSFPSKRI